MHARLLKHARCNTANSVNSSCNAKTNKVNMLAHLARHNCRREAKYLQNGEAEQHEEASMDVVTAAREAVIV
jgi:hypothetical protein